jgi:hypothetical protein
VNLGLGEFLRDATHELASWDGKVPATLRALFFQPGRLTIDFLAGRRARWLPPLRVYLICSVALFAGKPLVEAVTGRPPRQVTRIALTSREPGTSAGAVGGAAGVAGFFSGEQLTRALADPDALDREIDAAFANTMFLLLPLFALLTWLVWRRARRRYPAHLYLALHLHAALFGALALSTMIAAFWPPFGLVFLLYAAWYVPVALHRVFADSWPRTLAKTAALGIGYLACFFVVGLGLLAYAITRM